MNHMGKLLIGMMVVVLITIITSSVLMLLMGIYGRFGLLGVGLFHLLIVVSYYIGCIVEIYNPKGFGDDIVTVLEAIKIVNDDIKRKIKKIKKWCNK